MAFTQGIPRLLRWLHPGLGVKRWYALILLGVVGLGLGSLLVFDQYYGDLVAVTRSVEAATSIGLVLATAGVVLVVVGIRGLVRQVARTLLPQGDRQLVDIMLSHAQRGSGPRIVVVGGGTGLATLLRGLKRHTTNLTAVAAVSDDGGSSGRLRAEQGALPPGDVRACLAALADQEPLMTQLLQYRFNGEAGPLSGHNLGNLLLTALTEMTGDFETAVKEMGGILAIRGRVLPPTVTHVTVCATLKDGTFVRGESNVSRCGTAIDHIELDPPAPRALPEVIEAILGADVIVVGPGSTYTSVIPNLLVPEIAGALARTQATRIFVCNVMTQPGETDGFTAATHVEAVARHVPEPVFEYVLMNSRRPSGAALERYMAEGATFVEPDADGVARMGYVPISRDLLSDENYVRHDPDALAAAIMELALAERRSAFAAR